MNYALGSKSHWKDPIIGGDSIHFFKLETHLGLAWDQILILVMSFLFQKLIKIKIGGLNLQKVTVSTTFIRSIEKIKA